MTTAVVIGIDPHNASHTAVAVDERELLVGDVRVRATAAQGERLLAWAGMVATAHLGDRERGRFGVLAGSAAGGVWRADGRCAAQARRPGAFACCGRKQ